MYNNNYFGQYKSKEIIILYVNNNIPHTRDKMCVSEEQTVVVYGEIFRGTN